MCLRTKMEREPCVQALQPVRAIDVLDGLDGTRRLDHGHALARGDRVFQLPPNLHSELTDEKYGKCRSGRTLTSSNAGHMMG